MSNLLAGVGIFLTYFVALPVAILLAVVVMTLVVIAAHNFIDWAEEKWWK